MTLFLAVGILEVEGTPRRSGTENCWAIEDTKASILGKWLGRAGSILEGERRIRGSL